MTAAVLSIGTELTRGELLDANTQWLSEQLTVLGFEVRLHVTVDDDRARIIEEIERLAGQVRVVVCTGGLGPTSDDLTTACVAEAIGKPLVRDHATVEKIRALFAAWNREMPKANEKQGDFPEGATILPNPVGTAPGFAVTYRDTRFHFMPGVPREMKRIFLDSIRPDLAPLAPRTAHQIRLRTFGMTESGIAEELRDLEASSPDISFGYRASFPEIEVKVLARGDNAAAVETRTREVADEIRRRLGDVVYGEGDETLAGALGAFLRNRGLTISVAESCTGGMVGAMLTDVPGSSDYLLFDGVVYANSAKKRVLGVAEDTLRACGAVSAECAEEMARGALKVAESDLAIAITGVAGPSGGTEAKPVGTVFFGYARRGGPSGAKHRKFRGDRERIRLAAAHYALRLAHRAALGRVDDED